MRAAKFIVGFVCAAAFGASAARAQDAIRIGEINSYKAQAAFLDPYKKGLELAVEPGERALEQQPRRLLGCL